MKTHGGHESNEMGQCFFVDQVNELRLGHAAEHHDPSILGDLTFVGVVRMSLVEGDFPGFQIHDSDKLRNNRQ
ncbi:MAG: hypothetical protein QOE70_1859 [Chthoniobacter sp.]|nr:hypothetical protein [Chthoniobacter sp.]